MKTAKKPLALVLGALLLFSLLSELAVPARAAFEAPVPATPENLVWDGTAASWDAFVPPEELYNYDEYYTYVYYSLYNVVELFRAVSAN